MDNQQKTISAPSANEQTSHSASKGAWLKKKLSKVKPLFWAVVIAPTLLSSVYYGLLASDVYVSESQFVVRSPKNTGSLTGIGAILQSAGFARSSDDTYTVHAYMRSRDAMNGLNQDGALATHYSDKKIDMISRFNSLGMAGAIEDLFQYFQKKITIDLDAASSISTLKIKAYSAEEAQRLNEQLLQMGENLINQLNDRGRQDIIGYAQSELQLAEQRATDASKALNRYRIQNNIFDVREQAQIQGQLITKLQDELISVKTQLAQVQAVTPENPQIPALKARERSVQKEINVQMAKILGGGESIANKAGDFERLTLENKLAEQQLAASMTAFDNAKSEAQKKQLYLERIVQPNKPDVALEPQRLHNILASLILSLMVYGILKLLLASIRKHQQD